MATIPFTEYVLPHGRRQDVTIDVADDLAAKAQAIIARGFVFEAEILTNSWVSLTITDPEEGDMAHQMVPNGPGMREAVEAMIRAFPMKETN